MQWPKKMSIYQMTKNQKLDGNLTILLNYREQGKSYKLIKIFIFLNLLK